GVLFRRGRPKPAGGRLTLEPRDPFVKVAEPIPAAELPIGDDIGARAALVVDGQTGRIAQDLGAIVLAISVGPPGHIVANLRKPRRPGPASNHRDGQGGKSVHAGRLRGFKGIEKRPSCKRPVVVKSTRIVEQNAGASTVCNRLRFGYLSMGLRRAQFRSCVTGAFREKSNEWRAEDWPAADSNRLPEK